MGRINLRQSGMTIVLFFRRLRVPFGFRVFFSWRLKRQLSRGAKNLESSLSIKGRVKASTMAFCTGSPRRFLFFSINFFSMSAKSNARAALLGTLDANVEEVVDAVLNPDDER